MRNLHIGDYQGKNELETFDEIATELGFPPWETDVVKIEIPKGKIRFLHLRIHDEKYKIGQNRFGIANQGGVTVAYQRTADLLHFRYAIACCSLEENFSRYMGRMVAQQYLEDEDHYIIPTLPTDPDSKFTANNVIKKVMQVWLSLHPGFDMKNLY